MEPEASEFPKGLVLYGGGHVHIRHRGSFPLDDVGSNNTRHKKFLHRKINVLQISVADSQLRDFDGAHLIFNVAAAAYTTTCSSMV